MTDRRSLQADAARYSRQSQFVPGHVGGRVASAQPVRYRRHIGGVSAPPLTLPESSVVFMLGAYGANDPVTQMQAVPAGVTSAVCMYAHMGYTGATNPAGWTVAQSGTLSGTSSATTEVTWQVLVAGALTPGATPTFTLGSAVGFSKTPGTVMVGMYFVGGTSTPTITLGPSTTTTDATLNSVPAGAARWGFFGVWRSIWPSGSMTKNPAGIGVAEHAVIGAYAWPGVGTYTSGSSFNSSFTQTPPAGPNLDWSTLGALGPPGSQSFAVDFATPPE